MLSTKFKKMAGVIICGVFEFDCAAVNFSLDLVTENATYVLHMFYPENHKKLNPRTLISVKSGHMWLHYIPGDFIHLLRLPLGIGYRYRLRFTAIGKHNEKNVWSPRSMG